MGDSRCIRGTFYFHIWDQRSQLPLGNKFYRFLNICLKNSKMTSSPQFTRPQVHQKHLLSYIRDQRPKIPLGNKFYCFLIIFLKTSKMTSSPGCSRLQVHQRHFLSLYSGSATTNTPWSQILSFFEYFSEILEDDVVNGMYLTSGLSETLFIIIFGISGHKNPLVTNFIVL